MDIEDVDINHTQRSIQKFALDAMQHIFSQMKECDAEINGIPVEIKIFFPPKQYTKERMDHLHDRCAFGVDVAAKDGSWHLEFIMYNSGWGGIPLPKIKAVEGNQ